MIIPQSLIISKRLKKNTIDKTYKKVSVTYLFFFNYGNTLLGLFYIMLELYGKIL